MKLHIFDFDETLFYDANVEFGIVPGHYIPKFSPCGYEFTKGFVDFLGTKGIQTSRQKGNACILDYDNYEKFRHANQDNNFKNEIKNLKFRNGKSMALMHFYDANEPNYLPLPALEILKELFYDGDVCYILTARSQGPGCEEAIKELKKHGLNFPKSRVVCCGTSKKGVHMNNILARHPEVDEIEYYENSTVAIDDVTKIVRPDVDVLINKFMDDKVSNLGMLEYSEYRSKIPASVKASRSKRGTFNASSRMRKLSGL